MAKRKEGIGIIYYLRPAAMDAMFMWSKSMAAFILLSLDLILDAARGFLQRRTIRTGAPF